MRVSAVQGSSWNKWWQYFFSWSPFSKPWWPSTELSDLLNFFERMALTGKSDSHESNGCVNGTPHRARSISRVWITLASCLTRTHRCLNTAFLLSQFFHKFNLSFFHLMGTNQNHRTAGLFGRLATRSAHKASDGPGRMEPV